MRTLPTTAVKPFRPADAFHAVSHPDRRRILHALRLDGPAEPLPLAAQLGLSPLRLRHHLAALTEVGLVRERTLQGVERLHYSPLGWARMRCKLEAGLREQPLGRVAE